MKNAIKWFSTSSANKDKVAMTVKGLIPFLVFLGVGNIDTISNDLIETISAIGAIISGWYTLYGFMRKIYLSFKKK